MCRAAAATALCRRDPGCVTECVYVYSDETRKNHFLTPPSPVPSRTAASSRAAPVLYIIYSIACATQCRL